MLPTSCGVSSVLGPLLFTLCNATKFCYQKSQFRSSPLCRWHTNLHFFGHTRYSLNQLRVCLQDVPLEMKGSKLTLTRDKTAFLIISTRTQHRKLDGLISLTHIWRHSITPITSLLNLGVPFDENFQFQTKYIEHMSLLFYHIRDLCWYISLSVAKTITTVLVSSRLDYCNSLLYNPENKDIVKLQRVQKCLARVVTHSAHFSHSMPLPKSLHRFPVHYRIIFKICAITYQALSSIQLAHPNSLLAPSRNSRQLQSISSNPLYIPGVKTKAGTQAFSIAAPTLWTLLPNRAVYPP